MLALTLLTACASHPVAGSHARALASSTVMQADEQAAARLVQSCVTAAHLAAVKSCLEGKVPLAKRTALGQCLAADATATAGRPGAVARFRAGAQACVAKALAS